MFFERANARLVEVYPVFDRVASLNYPAWTCQSRLAQASWPVHSCLGQASGGDQSESVPVLAWAGAVTLWMVGLAGGDMSSASEPTAFGSVILADNTVGRSLTVSGVESRSTTL